MPALALAGTASFFTPFLLGISVGFCVALFGLRRWLARGATPEGRNLVAELRRAGIQSLVAGIVVTAAAAVWLSRHFPERPPLEVVEHALWGLPVGIFGGIRWVFCRGER